MQPTELETPETVVVDRRGIIWYRGTGSWVAANGEGSGELEPVEPVIRLVLETALTAESERADLAEARLEKAPHQRGCLSLYEFNDRLSCDCWKSEATA